MTKRDMSWPTVSVDPEGTLYLTPANSYVGSPLRFWARLQYLFSGRIFKGRC